MTEVVTFERARRRAQPWPGGDHSKGPTVFFNRHELNQILQVYSRRVMSGEWLDYALGWDEGGATFSIYGAASSVPIYSIAKRAKHARRQGGRYQVAARGRVLKTGTSLDGVLAALQRAGPRLVEEA